MEPCLLVIPCFNDHARLATYLPELCAAVQPYPHVRMLVVDDGSDEHNAALVRSLIEELSRGSTRVELLCMEKNVGKGASIYAGWSHARAEDQWLAFADADGATSASEVLRLLCIPCTIQEKVDVVIASRARMLGRTIKRRWTRHSFGRLFSFIAYLLVRLPVYDSQCGCKLVRQSAYLKIKDKLFEKRFCFDMDLLVNLHRAGAKIIEVPVDWVDIPGSKVSVFLDGGRMLLSLLQLRLRLRHSDKD